MPDTVGDYHIVDRLGGGSMAELFLAHKQSQYGFVRRAVLKRVRRSRPDFKHLQQMLLDEARATACFDHPNLVSLFDVGETDEGVYLALEYVEGSDLRRVNSRLRTRKEALPFELAAFITVEVLRGLHHAHTSKDQAGSSLEIIHRDVNPSNVLIARSGHVKLADFGVVRMRERVQQKTEPGLVKGKYAYLAPEYIAGEPCSVQTDVYAAGIMLFELLSGRECFSGKTAYEVMWKIVNKGVPMYRLEREGVPEDLQRIVQRATAMAPERRYQSAQEMANALEAWLMRSGRHATPWVLSVFFQRHELLPEKPEGARVMPLAQLGSATGGNAERRNLPSGINPATPRVVEPSLTPLPPELSAEMPTVSSPPRPASGLVLEPQSAPPAGPVAPAPFPSGPPEPPTAPRASSAPSWMGGSSSERPDRPTSNAGQGRFGRPAEPSGDLPPSNPPRYPPSPEPSIGGPGPKRQRSEAKTEPMLDFTPRAVEAVSDAPKLSSGPPPPPPMELVPGNPPSSGKLEQVSAIELLECLAEGQHTGVVEFRCGLIWKKVRLLEGKPVGVTSNMGMELIGEHLVKSKIITRDQLHKALQRSEREGRALTATLLEDGALERSALETELGKNLGARLVEVLEWRWGTFELKSESVRSTDIIPRLDLDGLLQEARTKRASDGDGRSPEESGELDTRRKLEKAIDMARSIASSSGRGQIERPWRPDES